MRKIVGMGKRLFFILGLNRERYLLFFAGKWYYLLPLAELFGH